MSMDNQESKCLSCGEVIPSHFDEVWPWDVIADVQPGPMHRRCADETVADDPTRWSPTEPAEWVP